MSLLELRAVVGPGEHGELVVRFDGQMDIESVSLVNTVVHSALLEGESTLVLDLSGVTFLDPRGIRALLLAHQAAEHRNATLVVRSPRKQALEVFTLTGCDRILNLQVA
jgi:anti-sigma B factor antagonist